MSKCDFCGKETEVKRTHYGSGFGYVRLICLKCAAELDAEIIDRPKVGDKCTMHLFSDSHACQVVRVSDSGKTMWIKRNKVEHEPGTEGGMGHQNWLKHENVFEGDEMKITKRKNGQWRETGSNCLISLWYWHEHYDWSF